MKKILALTFALVLCLSMFVACGINGDKAAENLKAEGYEVEEITDATMLEAMAAMIKKAGVELEGKIVKTITAEKDDEYINIMVFEKSSDAKAYFEKLDEQYDKIMDAYKEAGQEVDYQWGRDGAVVYEGTKAAIKAAK